MSSPLLKIEGLWPAHLEQLSLFSKPLNLQLREKETLGIFGPSGIGKSQLLRAMAQLIPCEYKKFHFLGQDLLPQDIPYFRSQVCYLPQRPSYPEMNPNMTVEAGLRKILEYGVHRHRRFDKEVMREYLLNLGRDISFLKKRLTDLSGGEEQIFALLRALQLNPCILLLDEPTAALDPLTARQYEGLLQDWIEQGDQRTYVLVSHGEEQLKRLCSRVWYVGRPQDPTPWIQGPTLSL